MTLTAIRPDFGFAKGRDMGLFSVLQASSLISALSVVLSELYGSLAARKYFVPNPIKPALLARSMNKAHSIGKNPTTADHDILRRRWLLIDCDPIRPAGISASEARLLSCDEVISDERSIGPRQHVRMQRVDLAERGPHLPDLHQHIARKRRERDVTLFDGDPGFAK